jgi:hypothetical protein
MRASSVAAAISIVISAAAPAFADAQSSVQAAKKHERRGEWRKALEAWKAAYSADVNAEYLIGIGDCYVHLGNNEEARKNYNAYLADPLALPANVEKVKIKIAALDSSAGGLALPGGGLTLPGSEASASASPPGLDLPGAAPTVAEKKGKNSKKGSVPPPPLPGLDLPGAAPNQVAGKSEPPGLALPGLDLPGTPAPSKKEPEKKVATASPALVLPGLPTPPPPATPTPEKKDQPAVATNKASPSPISGTKDFGGGQKVAIATKPEPRRVPEAAIAETPAPRAEASNTGKVVGYVAAGVAVLALGGGAFAYTQANSNHSDLTGKVRDGATQQSLLESEAKNKTLSFVGLAGGLVAAGIATALFVF